MNLNLCWRKFRWGRRSRAYSSKNGACL